MKRIFLILSLFSVFIGNAFADIGIYCPKCHRHLYDYTASELTLAGMNLTENFKAVDAPREPLPDDAMRCPFDYAPLNGYQFWFWDKGYAEPKMMFQGMTLLTKQGEEFVWSPYPVDIEDN